MIKGLLYGSPFFGISTFPAKLCSDNLKRKKYNIFLLI
jgi:hypothetical protein